MADDTTAPSTADGCPMWDDLIFENGEESYPNFLMGVSEVSPPGISGTATKPLGLTERPITVKGLMVGESSGKSLKDKQALYEAACETYALAKYTTGNGRVFEKVRFVRIDWGKIFAVLGDGGVVDTAEYVAVLKQTVPPEPP